MMRRAAARCTAVWRAAAAERGAEAVQKAARDVSSFAAQYTPDRSSFTLRRAVLFTIGAPFTALPVLAAIDDGVARSIYFNAHALPALAHYRFVEWLHKHESDEQQLAALLPRHERYAPMSLAVILRLKGFYIKVRPACSACGRTRAAAASH